MKQTRKNQPLGNAHLGPWSATMDKSQQKIDNIQESLVTNSAIIKNYVRKEKQINLKDFNKKIKHIPEYVSHTKYWNDLKKSTQDTSNEIFIATKCELMNVRKPIKTFRKRFEKIFSKSSHIGHQDIELLVKLAELKQKGIITTKEYEAKKKKILTKI
ncbi:MAG: SHOCT domain-containing protein [Candidatus Nitrosopelagicus sp.]|nr:SHOCT domain-containing protein [Candidatus Nitrosopelagicus sp.]